MDENRFDEAVCGGAAGEADRRGVLKGLAAGGLATALSRVTGRPAAAKKKKPKGPCNGKCGTVCDPRTAVIACIPNNKDCACVRSTSGKIHCANGSDPDFCPPAGSPDLCKKDADCGPDAVCVSTTGGLCCKFGGKAQVNICLPLCNAAASGAKSARRAGSLLGPHGRLIGR